MTMQERWDGRGAGWEKWRLTLAHHHQAWSGRAWCSKEASASVSGCLVVAAWLGGAGSAAWGTGACCWVGSVVWVRGCVEAKCSRMSESVLAPHRRSSSLLVRCRRVGGGPGMETGRLGLG